MPSTVEPGTSSGEPLVMGVGLIPPGDIPLVWHRIQEILEETEPHWLDRLSAVELLGYLYLGKFDLWAGVDRGVLEGFVLCRWENWHRVKFYCVEAVAGKNLQKYLKLGLEKVEQHAAIHGAREVVIDARWGVQRMFQRKGYSPKAVILRKDVQVLWRN